MMKVGMVGVGCISGIYLKNFAEVFRDVELVAVCDLIRERAENAQKKYNIPKLYDTMHELFADPEIDIVLNLTRPYQHYEVSKAALLAGKHVYSEKPLGASLEEGLDLVRIAKEQGLTIGGAPDTFMGGGIQTCRKLIDGGLIGRVIGGRMCVTSHGMEDWHPDPDFYYQYGGGPVLDMGPYYITAAINLLGGIKRVYGTANRGYDERLIISKEHNGEIIKVNVQTHLDSILTFEGGFSLSMVNSWDIYKAVNCPIEIYGTKGTLFVPDPNCFGGPVKFFDGEKKEMIEFPVEFDYTVNSRCLGLDDLAKALETGRPGRTTSRQTLHVLEVMTGIHKSAEIGQPVEIQSKFEREAPMDPTLPHGVL